MKGHATKLIEITERNATDIAKKWLKDVRSNPRTPAYQALPEDRALEHAVEFYSHFRALFCTEKPFQEAKKFFSKYADERFTEGIPLHEALYALVLMRRHIWLYAEFQAIFITAVEQHQAVESLTRTILMFDYATYVLAERYEELMKREMNERVKAKKKGEEWSFYETLAR
jgi:hypothetical protein